MYARKSLGAYRNKLSMTAVSELEEDALEAATGVQAPLKRDLVAGLEKGLAVIEAFDQERPRLTISQVAERTGLTRAAARRYLLTLMHLGFVSQDRKMFALTPKVLSLAQSYLHSARLPRIVEPELSKLAMMLKEASAACVLDGLDVVVVSAASAGRLPIPGLQPGKRVPAHCTSIGRVLLASLPTEQIDNWLAQNVFVPHTSHTITQPERLRIEIARARAQGYAFTDQEFTLGLRTIAVPLLNHRGDVVAALNLCVPAARMSVEEMIDQCLPPLLQTQAHLKVLL